jgi:Family of unknown function (DUF5317)
LNLFAVAVALGAVSGFLAGGRLRNLARLPVFWLPLAIVWVALALQFGMLLLTDAVATPTLLLSYALIAGAIGLVLVRVLRESGLGRIAVGLLIVGLGWLLNAVVIAANGGMPFDADALASSGMSTDPGDHGVLIPKRIPLTDDTHLAALGDAIQLPVAGTLVSLGDIVLAVGFAVLVFAVMTAPAPPESRLVRATSEPGRRASSG